MLGPRVDFIGVRPPFLAQNLVGPAGMVQNFVYLAWSLNLI